MPYLSKNIDGLVYSEEFGGWIEEQEMHDYYASYLEDQVDIHLDQ